jgi:diadenosine tetraphosphatase ApaH/serine/threonine PP2A family protein phosphatase
LKAFTLLHSSLAWEGGYIDHKRAAQFNLDRMRTRYGIFGHTHIQGYFAKDVESVTTFLACLEDIQPQMTDWQPTPVGVWRPLPGKWQPALFNPGSVGQPRRSAFLMGAGVSHDYRAAYMMLRLNGHGDGAFQFRRVHYDVEETIRLLRKARWPEEVRNEAQGHNIHKDDEGTASSVSRDPMVQKLSKTLDEINERLPRLVEEVLIPALR